MNWIICLAGLVFLGIGICRFMRMDEYYKRSIWNVLLQVAGIGGFVLYYRILAVEGVFERIHGVTLWFAVLGSLIPPVVSGWIGALVRDEIEDARISRLHYKLLREANEAAARSRQKN